MTSPTPTKSSAAKAIVLYTILLLFFFQLLADFVEAVYAFGLRGTSIPPEVVCILLLLSPVVLFLLPGLMSGHGLAVLGPLLLLSRVTYPVLDTRGKMIVAGIGTACFLIYLPATLSRLDRGRARFYGWVFGWSLALAVALSIVFRVWGSGVDISTVGWPQSIGWLLAATAAWAMWRPEVTTAAESEPVSTTGVLRFVRVVCLSLGLMGVLVTLYFSVTTPNVIARWTGVSYPMVVMVAVAGLVVFAWLVRRQGVMPTRGRLFVLNGLFVASMVLTILAHQTVFPAAASGYPLPAEPVFAWHLVPLLAMLLLWPVLLLDFALLIRDTLAAGPSARMLGATFLLGSLFLAVMIFAQVFTTVYDYIPVVGPFFRDKFWLVYLVVGLSVLLPCLLTGRKPSDAAPSPPRGTLLPGVVCLLGLATVVGLAVTMPRPAEPAGGATNLRILTYNIQQGYSITAQKNLDAQLDLIREVDADIIGLQESDTNRIGGGNCDLVRYYADRLGMHSYYGPKTVPGTFGVALLSKYPIHTARTFFMFSEGEQTAAIEAEIEVGGRVFTVYVTHLGNGGDIVQQKAILHEAAGKQDVILMGDFNFRPDGEQYALTRETLDDAWLLRWPDDVDDEGVRVENRIDHIFVTPGTDVREARYLLSPVSDHPAMMAQIAW